MKKKIKLVIKGAYGESNFGDDALMLYLLKWATKHNIKPFFIGKKAKYLRKYIPLHKYILVDYCHRYHYETLILGGGTQFFSFSNMPKKKDKWHLLFSRPILFFRKALIFLEKKVLFPKVAFEKVYSLGIGLGPFEKESERELMAKNQLKDMKGIYVRDKFSYEFAKKINRNTYLATDICFLSDIVDFEPYINHSNRIKRIGVVVRDWGFSSEGGQYFERILEETNDLITNSYEVDFILFKNEPSCELRLSKTNHKILKWDPEKSDFKQFLKALSSYDLFISARFHGVIFGALLNIPSIAIEIEPKLKVTRELLNEGVFVWEQPFTESLIPKINGMDYLKIKETLKEAVKHQGIIANKMFCDLLERIKQPLE